MNELKLYFDAQDILALLFFVLCWAGYVCFAESRRYSSASLLAATNRLRRIWMREMLRRDNRSVDAIMTGNLQRSITFFASTTIFILIGLMGMLSYHDRAASIFANIPFAKALDGFHWELRIFILIIIFIYAFFKYTWSLRQYNYAGIFIAAAPSHKESLEEHETLADQGGKIVGNAARHFNDGLRAYYFGLATLAWFIHPYLYMLASAWVVFVIHRREFRSVTLKNLTR